MYRYATFSPDLTILMQKYLKYVAFPPDWDFLEIRKYATFFADFAFYT